ncbi:hypothetical protein NL676_012833 [Syzygium grande]|nr:hypothetical protein NL676_012833 [Syzygium grande]
MDARDQIPRDKARARKPSLRGHVTDPHPRTIRTVQTKRIPTVDIFPRLPRERQKSPHLNRLAPSFCFPPPSSTSRSLCNNSEKP